MSDFTLDLNATGADGSTTVTSTSGDDAIGVTVSTPTTDGHAFTMSGGELKSSGVDEPTEAEFTFTEEVSNVTFEVFDVDSAGGWDDKITIVAINAAGEEVEVEFSDLHLHLVDGNTVEGDGAANGGVEGSGALDTVTVTIPGPIVSFSVIHDNGSEVANAGTVKIADISFDAAEASDGIVEGTSDDDLIDLEYTGDPDGDMIDNDDAILAGEEGDDDIVVAGAGDDTVIAGEGDDTVYGGSGSDEIYGEAGNDALIGGGSDTSTETTTVLLDFNDLETGEIVDDQFVSEGVIISSANSDNPVMIFDTANPTGGDDDLASDTLGNVLILSEDGDSDDPDDNANGGTFEFEFTEVSTVNSLTFHDMDNGAGTVTLFDADGNVIDTIATPTTADGETAELIIDTAGVSSMTVSLPGSGAIDNLSFTTETTVVDDAEDSDDVILGGEGDDYIEGNAGDDILYGDDGEADPATNLLINGGLESGQADGTFSQVDSIEGWQNENGQIETWGNGFAGEFSQDGGTFIELDVERGLDSIFQDVETTEGTTYTISVDVMQRVEGSEDQVEVYFGGELVGTITPGDEWETYTFEVTGSGDDRLKFSELSDENSTYGPLLDNISLVATGSETDGDDEIIGGDGNDIIYGEGGDDVIVGGETGLPDRGYGSVGEDDDTTNDLDTLYGGAGNDTISGGDDDDFIDGGADDDTIDGGFDDDTILGGSGDDFIVGGEGSDDIDGGDGDDTIYGGLDPSFPDSLNIPDDEGDLEVENGQDVIDGGAGNDIIFGQDDDDLIYGGSGNDTIDGGIDDDTIYAGAGTDTVNGGEDEDTIFGGGDNDVLNGGDDQDTINITFDDVTSGVFNTTVNGGAGGIDWDILNLSDLLADGWTITNHVQNPDSDGNGFDGQIQLVNTGTGDAANINYTNIEQVIPCFTPGTMIATPQGQRLVEELKVGDKVITRDNGLQEIRWVGNKDLSTADLVMKSELCPVMIRQGALGNGLPERDMMVSPNHRMLISSEKAALYFDDHEVLVAAKHLTKMDGVEQMPAKSLTYIHMMFDRHEVILGDGTWSESFQPGDYTLAGIGTEQREEIFTLFPELRETSGRSSYTAARRILRKHEAELLVS
jgi:Ca2+-binding RTX toxin-like protein